MGAGGSKPAEASGGSKHVFRSETPVQFSQNLVESLQSSSEVVITRVPPPPGFGLQPTPPEPKPSNSISKTASPKSSNTLADLEQRLVETTPSSTAADQGSISLDAPRVPLAGSEPSGTAQETAKPDLSSKQVAQEIEALREKLAARRKVKEVDAGVEKAREDVVNCLRGHEKRPLDCWSEVDTFKKEVARLEGEWVKKIVG
ncbi:conserved hypothetical protein [Uncinocarpus reesii 1704]|uniref:Altered inheritance of mitochondria protein 13, mitochondrial n=1 Tax=Uncinocarpus reesii (strain UAMH 1704) TaxID=336963 RepID=C4JPB9_UNCRE|nr:uncharacterized protein UREG_04501 [Uncinocarpus reesii 1704]EEP79655.1 conserved hypothetical protein [Uncinocarpus reesii 1704]